MARKWFKGPPPSVGWWPASAMRNKNMLRWWNGVVWSVAVTPRYSAENAARVAQQATKASGIEWQHRPEDWPERSKT